MSPLGTSIQQVLRSAAVPRLGFASCRARSCFLIKVPAEVLSPRGQGWSQPGRGSPGATASCTLQCCDHSAAALVEVRAGQEFSDATALMESARAKRKPLLLKKKKSESKRKNPSDCAKTKQFLYEPADFPAGSPRAQELTAVEERPGAC